MLKIISANLNGIRSADKKGFFKWLENEAPDVLCVQELKAQAADMTAEFLAPHGLHGQFQYALKKGYSGVGLYTRVKPSKVTIGFDGGEFDDEGRVVQVDFKNLSILSVYFPSGSSSDERQAAKFRFLKAFAPHLESLRKAAQKAGRELVLCGDVNIAHQAVDLKNWKGNVKNSGFLPEEREWLSTLFATGWVDVFRHHQPNLEAYTWWSNRGQAYANNVGWRIDYQFATPALAASMKRAQIYTETRFSDHAPLVMDYEFALE
jgi:exodeoxyribonuclease-3